MKMTKADREAIKARVKEMIAEGVDKEMAKTLAKVEIEYGIIKPVVTDEIEVFKF